MEIYIGGGRRARLESLERGDAWSNSFQHPQGVLGCARDAPGGFWGVGGGMAVELGWVGVHDLLHRDLNLAALQDLAMQQGVC
jgi:hypothetical protein